ELLKQVGRLLKEAVRASDTVARLGGDEFAVLLEACPAERAKRVAQQICVHMEEFRFLHDGRRFRIGTSIGLVNFSAQWPGVEA
ncbi:GGDEF domain-containing protein, partial [Klebsiella quasipneumoniae]|uniref:GGDEF domain-containing protein n=1 Tax=Klebsiella quasipneumoniae TaxID=1463165 RepID=UPI002730DD53